MRTGYFIAIGLLFALVVSARPAEAALLYLDPSDGTMARGDTKTVGIRIDTDENECINTVDALVHFDPSIQVADIALGKSIINLWVEKPKINAEEHTISFAGGIPGGYCGRIAGDPSLTNVIAEIVFQLPGFAVGLEKANAAHVWVDEVSQVLLHDGYGTPAPLRLEDATFTLLDKPGAQTDDTWRARVGEDTEPPSDFPITLSQDETAFSGKYFIVWNSQDKQSGIDHYEVMEEPFEDFYSFSWGGVDAPWKESESPYVLHDQTLNSTIRVKAIDKAGNETIAVLVPDEALRGVTMGRKVTVITIGLVVILSLGLIGYALIRRRARLLNSYEDAGE